MKRFPASRACGAARSGQRTPNQGFTLIELLMVIAIIAILASLLLPAIGLIRDLAKQVRCGGHQRQVMMAIITYAGDYDGVTPPGDSGAMFNNNSERGPYRSWPIALMHEDYLPIEPVTTSWTDNSHGHPYTWKVESRWPNVLACPSFAPGTNPRAGHTYGMRGWPYTGESFLSPWDGSSRMSTLKPDKPFLVDTAIDASPVVSGAACWAHNAVYNNVKVYLLHRRRVVAAFPDGHVQAMDASQLTGCLISSILVP